jgi:V/A-type H+/Na+-transporting ATPase subunit I
MIVPMKKICIVAQAKEADSAISNLRHLGVLHIEHQQPPSGKDITMLQEDIALLNEALVIISQKEFAGPQIIEAEEIKDWKHLANHIIDIQKRIDHLLEYSRTLVERIQEWKSWGDFDPEQLLALREKGVFAKLYRIPEKQLAELPEGIFARKIFSAAGIAHCLVIGRADFSLSFKEIALPKMGLQAMQSRLEEDKNILQSLKEQLKGLSRYQDSFLKIKKSIEHNLEFNEVIKGMGYAQALAYVVGYLPFDAVNKVTEVAKEECWGFLITEPAEEDTVPTLLRNPRWISLIKPIFKFLEILPGYRELDISLPFLIFFSIFFGMLIGDAGYGMVYAAITFIFQQKAKKKGRDTSAFLLFYALSFCAIVWGALTGTFFGQEWFLKAGYKPLAPVLVDEKGLQRFCFLLGVVHLSLAHTWRGILKIPSLSALGDLGWTCVLWAAFFIAKALILGDVFPSFMTWVLISGVTLILLFTNPQKNILKSGEEWTAWLVTLPLSFMSNFADVVSYIRLFAVGLAGVAIADAFNAMAVMIGKGNMLMIVLAALVALIGNALGIVLGPVSVLVHGVRLNVLEFSLHANISWSGISYKPLKE